MPRPRCVQCNTSDTLLWRTAENGQICIECHFANTKTEKSEIKSEASSSNNDDAQDDEAQDDEAHDDDGQDDEALDDEEQDDEAQDDDDDSRMEEDVKPADVASRHVRESTRSLRYKAKTVPPAPPESLERGRRSVFKRKPIRAHPSASTVVTSNCIFHKGKFMQVGDIIFMVHSENDNIYYAQIRRFLTDQKGEKSAVLQWLLPTKASPPHNEWFDPATYILGPAEVLPRRLSCMHFVMHAPSDYYKASKSPYLLTESELNDCSGFIWTSLEAVQRSRHH